MSMIQLVDDAAGNKSAAKTFWIVHPLCLLEVQQRNARNCQFMCLHPLFQCLSILMSFPSKVKTYRKATSKKCCKTCVQEFDWNQSPGSIECDEQFGPMRKCNGGCLLLVVKHLRKSTRTMTNATTIGDDEEGKAPYLEIRLKKKLRWINRFNEV